MKLEPSLFNLPFPETTGKLTRFISAGMRRLNRRGIVVPLSGGLDSSTVAALCSLAVGPENVTALLLPEKKGNPEAEKYARLVADHLHINAVRIDLSPLLKKMGSYQAITDYIPGRKLKEKLVKGFFSFSKRNPFVECLRGVPTPVFHKGYALMNSKHRLRLVMTYKYGEARNLLVAGAAHKSEDMVGLFVKFGVDDCADIMPLKELYRSQIMQIACDIKLPEVILQRSPNPDIIPGVSDKYRDVLGLESELVDLILIGFENRMAAEEIAAQLSLPLDKIREIEEVVKLSAHKRQPSQSLRI